MSWWLNLSREQLNAQAAERFAVNRAAATKSSGAYLTSEQARVAVQRREARAGRAPKVRQEVIRVDDLRDMGWL